MFNIICENYYTHQNGCYYCPNFYGCLINSKHDSAMKDMRIAQNDEIREREKNTESMSEFATA